MENSHYPDDSSALFQENPSILPNSNSDLHSYTIRNAASIAKEGSDCLSALYSANESMKDDAAKLVSNRDTSQKLESLLEGLVDGANTVLEALAPFGNAHPALAVAIIAFHGVVKLDIARRDNNKKVLVMVLQMQGMLEPIFLLRNLNHSHIHEEEQNYHKRRLSEISETIEKDINACRSDIMHFMNSRKFFHKLVLAHGYEKRFSNHMGMFAQRRTELQSVILEYIAIGTSTANVAIAEVGEKVDTLHVKFDVLFRSLDTPREKDVFTFMRQNGGPENCVDDPILFAKLVSKAGESPKTGDGSLSDQAALDELRKSLNEALKEDLNKVLEKHYSRFEKVLEVQSNNLRHISSQLDDQSASMQMQIAQIGKLLNTVTIMVLEEGKLKMKEIKLKDPEIQDVWTRMKLGSTTVKAKSFVLTFRDHIPGLNSATNTPVQGPVPLPNIDSESSALQSVASNTDKNSQPDWGFEYIDVAYVQPIVEAMDEDLSGFVSVKEANNFALSHDRPKDMKLLSWIAYWAAGWHINLIQYQKHIYSILLQMHEALPSIHIANRTYVDDFLDKQVMRRVEALCRSLKPLPDTHRKDPKLLAVANEVASWQLDRLKTNVKHMDFHIETSFYVTAVSGSTRVEMWIFPLLYLLLQRYLEVVNVAKTVVLDPREFEPHVTSLTSIFSMFDERMESLQAKFCQLHKDVDAQFHSFAYGMFYAAYRKNELDASFSTLLKVKNDQYIEQKDTIVEAKGVPDTSILSKLGQVLELDELNLLPTSPPPPEHVAHPIEGNWLGWITWDGKNHLEPYRCNIHPIVDSQLVGKGEAFFGAIDIVGTISPDPESEKIKVKFDFIPTGKSWGEVCSGIYDPARDIIEGIWKDREPTPAADDEILTVAPTPTSEPEVSDAANEKPTSLSAEGNEELLNGQTSKQSTDGPSSPDTSGKVEIVQPESAEEGKIESDSDSEKEPDRRFYLTRTPPYAFRFRSLLDGPGPAPCWGAWPLGRKRWAFATKAVLHRTRLRMWSKKAIGEALAERRLWLYHTTRYDLFDSFTNDEWSTYDTLMRTMQPDIARLWEKTGHFITERQAYAVAPRGTICDICRRLLAFSRYQCITCMDSDLRDCIDLCQNCFDDKPKDILHGVIDDNFVHVPSHSLLRSQNRLHPHELNGLIPTARLTSEQCKKMFRELEDAKKDKKVGHVPKILSDGKRSRKVAADDSLPEQVTSTEKPPIKCSCCKRIVALPCWVCLECSPLAFICISCDRKNIPIDGAEHSVIKHHLLFIRDSTEVIPTKAAEGSNVERQLEVLNTSITTLDEKMNRQLEDVKQVAEDMARMIGVEWDEGAALDEDTIGSTGVMGDEHAESIIGPKDTKLGREVSVFPASAQGQDNGYGDKGSQYPKSALGNGKTQLSVNINGDDSKGGEQPRPAADGDAPQLSLRDRLTALEENVNNINLTLRGIAERDQHSTLGHKLDALEAKMDRQLGAILALMQNSAAGASVSRPLTGSSRYYPSYDS